MLYLAICRVLGRCLLYLTAILFIPLGVSILYEIVWNETIFLQTTATTAFLMTILICGSVGLLMAYLGRRADESLHRKESILLVVVIWFLTAAVAGLPFYLTHAIDNPIDAYFEAMSGLTTTGSTIIHPKAYDPQSGKEVMISIANPLEPSTIYTFFGTVSPVKDEATGTILHQGLEALGKPLLFWRSFLEWIGGLGVVVLFIALLPTLGLGGKFLYESEVSGPTKERITPRIKETTGFLWKIYVGLTLLQIVLLLLVTNFELSFFDAVTLSFTTISTGGFTVHNAYLNEYLNVRALWIISIFMILGGLNFSLYFHPLKRKVYRLFQSELFFYLIILAVGSVLVSLGLWLESNLSFWKAMLYGSFQAISAQTSTGFSIANFDLWPYSCQLMILLLMYIGGMSGSTAGGLKIIRFVIMWKAIAHQIESFFRPEVVRVLKVGNKEIPERTMMTVFTFFGIATSLVAIGTYLLVVDGNDILTSFSIISTTINNNGLNLGGIGGSASWGFLSNFSKIISIVWMVLGRLEFFSLLVLFVPAFWINR